MKQSIIEFQILSIYLIVISFHIIKKNHRKIYHSHLSQNQKKPTTGFFFSTGHLPSSTTKQKNFHTTPQPKRNENPSTSVVQAVGTLGFTPAIVAFSNHSSAAVKPSNFDTWNRPSSWFSTNEEGTNERCGVNPSLVRFFEVSGDPNPKTGIRHDFRKAKGSQKTVGCFRVI